MNQPSQLRKRYPRRFNATDSDLYFGRKNEIRELTNLVIVEKLVVLFARSGMGKMAMLKAGAEPVLLQNGFLPFYFQLNCSDHSPETIFENAFREAAQNWGGLPVSNVASGSSFWELVKSMPFEKDGKKWVPVFIFSRFEEFFTTWPNEKDRIVFIKKLAGLLSDRTPDAYHEHLKAGLESGKYTSTEVSELEKPPEFRVLVSIRNDSLYLLDELSLVIPAILKCRLQLFSFKTAEAREAILRPAARPGHFASQEFSYSPDALDQILSELGPLGEVEPVRLQLLCSEIENMLIAQDSEPGFLVTPDFYGGVDGIKKLFEGFYEKQLALLSPGKINLARRVVEMALLTPSGKRHSVEKEEIRHETGASDELLDELVELQIIRKDPRLDSVYYEIAQEDIVPPIWRARLVQEKADRIAEQQKQESEAREELARQTELAESRRKKQARDRQLMAVSMFLIVLGFMYNEKSKQEKKATEEQKNATWNWNKMKEQESLRLQSEADGQIYRAQLFEQNGESAMADQFLRDAINKDSTRRESFQLLIDSLRNHLLKKE